MRLASLRKSLVAGASVVFWPAMANGQLHRRFDPEDLQLEGPMAAHADMQFGVVRSTDRARWLLPDFDFDVGLSSNVELGLDGSWAVAGTRADPFAFSTPVQDNLWFSSKVMVLDAHDGANGPGWALGFQLGPRFPIASDVHGMGAEGLALAGFSAGAMRLVLNAGGLVDPGDSVGHGRPRAGLAGFDFIWALNESRSVSVNVDCGIVVTTDADVQPWTMTGGFLLSPTKWLDVYVNFLGGPFQRGDRIGALLGLAFRWKLE